MLNPTGYVDRMNVLTHELLEGTKDLGPTDSEWLPVHFLLWKRIDAILIYLDNHGIHVTVDDSDNWCIFAINGRIIR